VSLGLIASVAIASWAFTLTTIACYKLDYAGERKSAQLFSACHLLLCLALFAVAPFGAGLYVAFAIGETVLLLAVLASCLRHWKSSEYTLFWRHATAW
jgi:O-antigen/teichoic acid export membrane protein